MNGQFQIGNLKPWRYFMAVGVAVGLMLGFTAQGPEEAPSWGVMLQWQIQSISAIALLVFCQLSLGRVAGYTGLNPWLQLLLSGIGASFIIAPIFLMVDIANGSNPLPQDTRSWIISLLDEISGFLPPVLVTWLAINAPFCLGYRLVSEEPTTNLQQDSVSNSLKFTECELDQILYIKAELHYINIVTEKDSELVLYNLRDAVEELPPSLGTVCHRSYWVAYSAIDSFEKKGRQGLLLLSNGDQIPVSRQHVAKFT